jgi:hypothetical protein
MQYTKPTILNETKATPLIKGFIFKWAILVDSHPGLLRPRTAAAAYEADE